MCIIYITYSVSHYRRNLCHIRCLVKLVTLTSISLYDFTLYGICFFFINLRLNLAKTMGHDSWTVMNLRATTIFD